jgi:hypothetical protein
VTFGSNEVELPAASLCTRHQVVISRSKIAATSPWKEEIINIKLNNNTGAGVNQVYDRLLHALDDFNLTEFGNIEKLHKIGINAEDVIISCSRPKPRSDQGSFWYDWSKCSDETKVIASINGMFKCFTLFYNPQTNSNRKIVDKREVNGQYLYRIRIKFNNHDSLINDLKPYHLLLHHPSRILTGFETHFVDLSPSIYYTTLSTKTTVNRLSAPYPTDCQNYITDGLVSQQQCFENCRTNLTVEKCGGWPEDVNAPLDSQLQFVGELFKKCQLDTIKEINKICNEKCSKSDCVSEYYTFRLVRFSESGSMWMKDKCYVDIIVPPTPGVDYTHNPKFETVEFVCYVASVISMWFGFAIFPLYGYLEAIFEKYSKRKIAGLITKPNLVASMIQEIEKQSMRIYQLEIEVGCKRNTLRH